MSFAVNLMYNADPYNKIQKNPTDVLQATGTLKDGCSLVDPTILIEYTGTLSGANYAYIPEFGRYYFIKDISSYRTGLWSVTMHCDVLKTYASSILSSPAIAARSSSDFNQLMNDDEYYVQENPYIFTKQFPSGFNTSVASYVLALVGQAASGEEE